MAADYQRVCAVGDDRLVCWGWDNSSTEIPGEFEAVSVNDRGLPAACVIDRKGVGQCWGNHIAADAAHAASLGPVVSVSAGYQHGCGLRASGEVVCVGVPRPPPPLRLRQLSTATVDDTRCGITMDGATYCWGDHSTSLDLPEI